MQFLKKVSVLSCTLLIWGTVAHAQVSTNPNKFLGNITTWSNVDAGGGIPQYYTLWNQITCENESKWSSVEGTRGTFNWSGADRAFNYAQQHGFTYKFHALVWGAQYPGWLSDLSPKERFAALTNWFDHAREHYETLPMIDVVNEAVGMHQQGNPMMKETLGGGGKTGYDWLIKAFDMAYERWPNSILIYNDYNSIQYDIDNYLDLVRTLRDAGAPIDAYGNQSHAVANMSSESLSAALNRQQNTLKMPMFITELDIDIANDAQQKAQYQKVLPVMWEAPYCAGVTLWGYVMGKTWVDNSGLYQQNGTERPAMTWIKEYMQTDAAKNAVGPFPGTVKEASVYIRPSGLKVIKDDNMQIKVHATMATKSIQKVELFVNNELAGTKTSAPFIFDYVPTVEGWNDTKAVVTATDGTTYERYGRFFAKKSKNMHTPYNGAPTQIPGTIVIAEYDKGTSDVNFFNASRSETTAMQDGQWMEYTVDVAEDGLYSFDATVASTNANGSFHLAEYGLDKLDFLTEYVEVPKTGGASEWKTLHGMLQMELTAGRHVFTILIDKGGFYFRNLTLNRFEEAQGTCLVKAFSQEYGVGDHIKLQGKFTASNSSIKEVRFYANNLYVGTATEDPYQVTFIPTEMGTYSITAILVNNENQEKESKPRELKITSPTPTTAIRPVAGNAANATLGRAYSLTGVPVGDDYRGVVIINGKTVIRK